jgi:hypothetical protein
MFAYNPTPDRSGEILGAGQMQAAATNAQAMSQMGQDIGGALQAIGGIYAQGQQVKSDAKIYGDLIKFAAPVLGDTKGEMLKSYNEMNTRDQANFGRLLFGGGTFATMSQGYNFGMGNQTRKDQQALTARGQNITLNMPAARAQQNAAAQVAAGQGRVTTLPPNINPDVVP